MEWAPGNVLSQSSKTESIENNSAVVGEHDVKKVMLEQYVEGISDVDADPDRVEVSFYMLFFFPISFISSFLFTHLTISQTNWLCYILLSKCSSRNCTHNPLHTISIVGRLASLAGF